MIIINIINLILRLKELYEIYILNKNVRTINREILEYIIIHYSAYI